MMNKKNKQIAVLISDDHYSLNTFEIADNSYRLAIDKASELGVPLVDCGDITHDKAIIRAEYANAIIETLNYAKEKNVPVYILVGNHSLINEKSKSHSLNFLKPYATVIDTPIFIDKLGLYFIPYCSTSEEALNHLSEIPHGATVIMHQGVQGAFMGEYVIDRSSFSPSLVEKWRIISGHYHRRQDLGTISYVGSPYTTSFSEAEDGPKGICILYKDGSLEQIPFNFRKHVVLNIDYKNLDTISVDNIKRDDIIWVKLRGPRLALSSVNKKELGHKLFGHTRYKLDLIFTENEEIIDEYASFTESQILDDLIDTSNENGENKIYLKTLWRRLLDEAT